MVLEETNGVKNIYIGTIMIMKTIIEIDFFIVHV